MSKHFQLLIFSFQFLLVACSTVSHLPDDELLYTGTRAITVTDDSPSPLRDQAVNEAKKIAQSGDIVLLSPTTSSFDQYSGYEERGRHFKSIVNAL
jgi:hypothetical protein